MAVTLDGGMLFLTRRFSRVMGHGQGIVQSLVLEMGGVPGDVRFADERYLRLPTSYLDTDM